MFVENIPKTVHARLLTIGDDSQLMEAAKLLTSGTPTNAPDNTFAVEPLLAW